MHVSVYTPLCVSMCVCVCMHICVCFSLCVYLCVYVCVCMSLHMLLFVCLCVHLYACLCALLSECVYLRAYLCTWLCLSVSTCVHMPILEPLSLLTYHLHRFSLSSAVFYSFQRFRSMAMFVRYSIKMSFSDDTENIILKSSNSVSLC